MDNKESQQEEQDVLLAIYDGDDNFKQLNPTTFQYRVGEVGHFKSFLLEIVWGETYPTEIPHINLEAFYNKHISASVKNSAINKLEYEAEQWLESAMTYTLFEWAKENSDTLMEEQQKDVIETKNTGSANVEEKQVKKVKEKKEHLTKAQKRKMADRIDFKGERPRGWDWVDIVKHLARTGQKTT